MSETYDMAGLARDIRAEFERLTKERDEARATIRDLIEKAEPFVKAGNCKRDDERGYPDNHYIGFGLQVRDLRSLSEAVAKAREGI